MIWWLMKPANPCYLFWHHKNLSRKDLWATEGRRGDNNCKRNSAIKLWECRNNLFNLNQISMITHWSIRISNRATTSKHLKILAQVLLPGLVQVLKILSKAPLQILEEPMYRTITCYMKVSQPQRGNKSTPSWVGNAISNFVTNKDN